MKQSTISLLLGISLAVAGERTIAGRVYSMGEPLENATITVAADTTVSELTDSEGKYTIRLDPVGLSSVTLPGQMSNFSIKGNRLSFEKNVFSEISVNDFRGRLLFNRAIPMGESALKLPSFAKEPLLITLTSLGGSRETIRWIAGESQESLASVGKPSLRNSVKPSIIPVPEATMTVEYSETPTLQFPIILQEGGFPNRIDLIDSTAGNPVNIEMKLIEWNENNKTTRVPFAEFDTEEFTSIYMEPETEYVLSAEDCYTEIRRAGNNGFIAVDLDTAHQRETSLYGTIMNEEVTEYNNGPTPFPPIMSYELCYTYKNTPVTLYHATEELIIDEVLLDSMGRYHFPDVPNGEYRIGLPDFQEMDTAWIQSVSTEVSRKNDLYGEFFFMAVAPNIYLYPEETSEISVEVSVKNGGSIPYSIPKYNDGWHVTADPDGNINDSLGFLYYDFYSNIPYQSDSGWVISMDNFDREISDLLTSRGLNEQEIFDFIDFWKKYLVEYDWAVFCPIDAAKMVELTIEPEPVTLFRELYLVLPSKGDKPVFKEPARGVPFERKGFTVVEWGGHLAELELDDVIKNKN